MLSNFIKNLFKKKELEDNYSLQHLSEFINFSIDCFIKYVDEQDDEFIYNQMLDYIKNVTLTNQIYVFIPVAITRIFFQNMPIKLSETYLKVNGSSKSKEIQLNSISIYNHIFQILNERYNTFSKNELLSMLEVSSEFKVINQALNNGSKLENIVISPPASGV